MNAVDIGHGRGWLDAPAAASLHRVDAALGHPLQVTSAGRTRAQQWDAWRKYGSPRAAYPGTSTHETGRALDTDERVALLPEHGWTRPFNNPGRKPYEPWHYLYDPTTDKHQHDTTTQEDDMIINIQGRGGVRRGGAFYIANGVATFLGAPIPGIPTLDYDAGTALAKRVSGIA